MGFTPNLGAWHLVTPKGKPKKGLGALASVAQLVGTLSHKPKGCGFNSWSGHMPELWVQPRVQAHARGNQLMFLYHINVSLLLSLPSSLSLPSPL